MRRFVIVGLGNFGASVAEALHAAGHEVVALDVKAANVDRIAPLVTRAAVGDGTDLRTLERVGVREADASVVSTGDDITASVLTALALRDLGLREIYVKVVSANHGRIMDKLGVTETIFPERESALWLARRITSRGVLNYVQLATEFGVQEMAVPAAWIGKSLRDLELPRRHRIAVIAVHDMLTDAISTIPDPDAPLKDSDTLMVAGRDEHLTAAAQLR